MMIPDGCDEAVQTLARWYKGKDLHLDGLPRTSVKTFVANSVIADSASAATAFATGYKTSVGFLSVGPRHDNLLSIYYNNATEYDMALQYAPMATILEAAKSVGKSTGLGATGQVVDATPAAFASHVDYRYKQEEIMKHLVHNNVDVVFGGGKEWLLPASSCPNAITNGGRRLDCQDLRQVLEQRGYKICETRQQLQELETKWDNKVYGIFADKNMRPDVDRKHFAPNQPSLVEMVEKAVEILARNKKGFFLVVEGSLVDLAGHNNDVSFSGLPTQRQRSAFQTISHLVCFSSCQTRHFQ